jgi:Arc/MetJ-type ribon-helix-helix transcriptional regulator
MTTRKIAVSVPEELVEDARRAVAAGATTSVSAYVTEAMRSFRHSQTLGELLAELDATDPIPADTRRWAEQELDRVAEGPRETRAAG